MITTNPQTQLSIEQNIPIPPTHLPKYPGLDAMQIGDSILFPNASSSGIHNRLWKFKHMVPRRDYTTRKISGIGIRVWRTR